MRIDTSALCDIYSDQVDVVEPIFSSFGGASSFSGQITTVKCFESNGIIVYGAVRQLDVLETLDIGIHALAPIPVGADDTEIGEIDTPVNFGGVTFFPEDYVYADLTGIILSPEALDLNELEEE